MYHAYYVLTHTDVDSTVDPSDSNITTVKYQISTQGSKGKLRLTVLKLAGGQQGAAHLQPWALELKSRARRL